MRHHFFSSLVSFILTYFPISVIIKHFNGNSCFNRRNMMRISDELKSIIHETSHLLPVQIARPIIIITREGIGKGFFENFLFHPCKHFKYLLIYKMYQFNIEMFFLLYYFLLLTVAQAWILKVNSGNNTQEVQIPPKKMLSCQLAYISVYNLTLNANISDLESNITNVFLNFDIYNKNISNNEIVVDNSAYFTINFTGIKQIEDNKSQQAQVNIKVMTNGKEEERRAYLIFRLTDKKQYRVELPHAAMAITQLIGLFLILILPLNVQYRKFLPFTFNMLASLIYIIILFVGLYLQFMIAIDWVIIVQSVIVGVFSWICVFLYSQDLLSYCFNGKCPTVGIPLLFTIVIMGCDEFVEVLEDNFILNNIIAIMVAGAFIKFVIIRKLNNSILPLVLLWIFFIFRQFLFQQLFRSNQNLGIPIIPLFLQIPKIIHWDKEISLVCSAFGGSKIISFGLLLNYSKRIDIFLSTRFYRILNMLLVINCVLFELFYNFINDDVPAAQFISVIIYYPLALLLMLFFANKRGEWAEIWHGSFYDMAVNRGSIECSVNFQQIQRSFGEDLLINKASLSSSIS